MRLKFVQKIIDIIRGKDFIRTRGTHNVVEYAKENKKNLRINVVGDNNSIIIKPLNKCSKGIININIFGDNCTVKIDENFYVSNSFNILIGQNHPNFGKVKNSTLNIGNDVSMEKVEYMTFNSNSFCNIKEQCVFAGNPAKVVKENIDWDANGNKYGYIENLI